MVIRKVLAGNKGGGKGGGAKDNAPNSLRSGASIRLIDLWGEGEIKGLVDGAKSIFFDDTQLKADDDTFNFKGVTWEARNGLPDQPYVQGFSSVESEEAVGVLVTHSTPIVRTISGEDLDAVRVTVELPALAKQSDGRFVSNSVQFRLEVQYNGGPWVNQFGDITINGKCTSAYDREYFLSLPRNPSGLSSPWSVRMTRITADSTDATKNQNDTIFGSMTKITFGKFTYPNSAYIAMTVAAEQFGQSVPTRSYEVYGRIVQVPVNYDPETRVYTGIWNGTFKWEWTDNPAWVLYDILTNDRFGLGDFVAADQVDKWSLYEIAQYCDQLVPDGSGGTEPRFTFNGWIDTQEEAFDAIQSIASTFRGMAFWSSGSVMATQDRPADVAMLANSSNVIEGSFSYQGSALKARHTVAIVKFDNPALNYEQDYVVVEDSDGIELYGYRETEITATGCTSRAQAHRIGEWALFTELNETQVVSYSAGLDHAGVRPGDIIAVQDKAIANADFGGRVRGTAVAVAAELNFLALYYRIFGENKPITDFPYTRAGAATYIPSSGGIVDIAANTPRIGDQGLFLEEARTNVVADNYFEGVTVTGLLPVNTGIIFGTSGWSMSSQPGIRIGIIAKGVTDGVPWVDIQWTGTNSGGGTVYPALSNKSATANKYPCAPGEVWQGSAWCSIDPASTPSNKVLNACMIRYTQSDGTYVGELSINPTLPASTPWARRTIQRTLPALAGLIHCQIHLPINAGETVSYIARIGAPQLEKVSSTAKTLSSPIKVPQGMTATATRAVDNFTLPLPAGTYNITVVFDNDTTQMYTGVVITGSGGWPLPSPLNRAYVKSIAVDDVLASSDAADQVTLDHPVTFEVGKTYSASLLLPSGEVQERGIFVRSYGVPVSTISLDAPYSFTPERETPWVIASDELVPSLWRCISIHESEAHLYEIVGAQHEPSKFEHIDNSARFDPLPVTGNPVVQPPTNLDVRENLYTQDGQPRSGLLLSWTPPDITSAATAYEVSYDGPDGYMDLGRVVSSSVTIFDTHPGEYTFYVASVSFSNRVSQPASVTYTTTGWVGTPTGTVTNLRVKGKSTAATTFEGNSAEFEWDNVWTGLELGEDGTNPVYRDNVVEIYDTTTNELLRSASVRATTFSYTLDMNKADNALATVPRGPSRAVRIEVVVRDVYGRSSAMVQKSVTNPAPAAITPSTMAGIGQFFVTWNVSNDLDLAGYLVWIDTNSGFNPLTTPPFSDGRTNTIGSPITSGDTVYIRAAAYDNFGKTGLNISGEINYTDLAGTIDTEAPAIPTGLAATSAIQPDGKARVTFTWTANTETDLVGYDILLKEGTGSFIGFNTNTNVYFVDVLPGTLVTGKVRAYDRSGNASGYTANVAHTAATDTTAPAAPTGLAASAGIDSIWLSWTPNTETDLDHYLLYENSVNTSGTATLVGEVAAATVARTGLPISTTKYYWVKAVDTSGNASAFSSSISATTGALPDADIVTLDGMLFSPNVPSTNTLSWAAGSISYGPAGGAPTTKAISTGSVAWTTGTQYVYYVKGNTTLSTTTSLTTLYSNSGILIATYKGGVNVQLAEGKTLIDGQTVIAGTIGASQLVTGSAVITGTAQIADAIITNAKISDLSAAKLTAGTALAGSITVSGTALSTIQTQANDPAARINAASTQIDPGKMLISGTTTLADWRNGTDTTKIEGGSIAANTITANKLSIGSRGISVAGIDFSVNKATSVVSWTAGWINYVNDAGTVVASNITAGSVTLTSGFAYIWWVKGATTLSSSGANDATTQFGANNVPIASYQTPAGLAVNYGATIIDGTRIVTGTITATQIAANTITAALIVAGTITGNEIAANTITANKAAFGFNGNLLKNSDFSAGLTSWGLENTSNAANFTLSIRSDNYAPLGGAYEIRQPGSASGQEEGIMQTTPAGLPVYLNVEAGAWYEMSGRYYGHRCVGVQPYIQWLDAAGTHISYSENGVYSAAQNGNPNYSVVNYQSFFFIRQAPAGAARALVFYRHKGVVSGQTDAYLWLYQLFFSKARAGQTEATPWSDGAITMISGGNIFTNTITADKMSVSSLSAITASVGTLTSGMIRSSDSKMQVDLDNKRILIQD